MKGIDIAMNTNQTLAEIYGFGNPPDNADNWPQQSYMPSCPLGMAEPEYGYDVPQNGAYQMGEAVSGPSPAPLYTEDFLRSMTGRLMRVEFLLGNHLVERVGRLIKAGRSYILLQSIEPNTTVMCDMSSIKFVSIIGAENNLISG